MDHPNDHARVLSGDGCIFSVRLAVIDGVSLPLSQRWINGTNDGSLDAMRAPPTMSLPEDGETVLALLLACINQGFVPIDSIDLAEAFVKSALQYQIPLPSATFAHGFFSTRAIAGAPLRYCALAWNTGRTRQVLETSRFALSKMELQRHVGWARETMGGEAVLLALSLTQLDRASDIANIVAWLPTNLKCPTCQAEGRNTYSEMKETVETVFEKPYPDLHSIVNPLTWVSSVLSDNCPRGLCEAWTSAYRFEEEDVLNIMRAATVVSQTVKPTYLTPTLQEGIVGV